MSERPNPADPPVVEMEAATPEPLSDDRTAPYPVPAATIEALAVAQPVISWWLRVRRRLSWWER